MYPTYPYLVLRSWVSRFLTPLRSFQNDMVGSLFGLVRPRERQHKLALGPTRKDLDAIAPPKGRLEQTEQ